MSLPWGGVDLRVLPCIDWYVASNTTVQILLPLLLMGETKRSRDIQAQVKLSLCGPEEEMKCQQQPRATRTLCWGYSPAAVQLCSPLKKEASW